MASFTRKHVFAKLVAATVASATAVVALDIAAASASGGQHPAAAVSADVRAQSPSIPAPAAKTSSEPGNTGNLSVTVPPIPPQSALLGLCIAFLAGNGKSDLKHNANEFEILIGATGGTVASTTNWCQNYVRYRDDHPSR